MITVPEDHNARDAQFIPCPHCGAELAGEDWKDEFGTYVPTDADGNAEFTFQGQPAERPMPVVDCPECGEEVPI